MISRYVLVFHLNFTAEKTSMALLSHFYLYYDRVCTTAGLKDEMKSFRKDLSLVCY